MIIMPLSNNHANSSKINIHDQRTIKTDEGIFAIEHLSPQVAICFSQGLDPKCHRNAECSASKQFAPQGDGPWGEVLGQPDESSVRPRQHFHCLGCFVCFGHLTAQVVAIRINDDIGT